MKPTIKWLRHSSVLIEGQKNIAIDPWKIDGNFKADIVLITHSHFDHLSPDDIRKLLPAKGTVIAPAECFADLQDYNCVAILPGEVKDIDSINIKAIPAYNVNKEFHPKENNWVGYVVTMDGQSIYITGDSDATEEMKAVKADVIVLPVGGTYTMDAREAAEVVNTINPGKAIPIHYGDITGKATDGKEFAKLVDSAKVEILSPICD